MAIALTERAAEEIRRVMTESGEVPEGAAVRIGVRAGGCSGFSYSFGFDDDTNPEKDHVSEQHGVTVAVEKAHELYLDGTEVDFHDGLESRGFVFKNPNVVKGCGCGSSFSV